MWTRMSVPPGSVEDGADGAAALELEEAGGAGHEDATVPQPRRRLALGGRAHHGPEERHALDRDDRRAHVVADEVDAPLVAGPQAVVVFVGVGVLGELDRQADLLERGD